MRVPNTICPGVAGVVSWTAVSSVLICRVKLLPFTVTMVIIPPGSVACRGTWSCSLCWPLQKWNLQWEVLFVCVCLFCLPMVIWIDWIPLLLTTLLLEMLHKFVNFPLFRQQFRSSTVSWVSINTTEKSCTLAPMCKISKWFNYYLYHAPKYLSLQLLVKCHGCHGWRMLDMNPLTMNLFNWCTVCMWLFGLGVMSDQPLFGKGMCLN